MPRRIRACRAEAIRRRSASLALSLTVLAACESARPGPAPTPQNPPPGSVGPAVSFMLDGLSAYVTQAIQENQSLLPNNPQSASFIQAKIAMLQRPGFASEVANGGRWASGQVTSANGRTIAIGCIFALEAMRSEATDAVRTIETAIPVLESFLDTPSPVAMFRIWYGFVVGNSGGGGVIYTEDRTTYESRTPATRLPHEAILGHEAGHSFIGNEALNQFLEIYTYNVRRTGATDIAQWTFTRNWTPGLASNENSAALLDIYQLVGLDVMKQAYRAILPLRPAYGQPLSPAVVDAFVAQVPEPVKAQVSDKLARITF